MLQNILQDYSTPDKALNQCYTASQKLFNILTKKVSMDNIWVIECNGWRGDICGMHSWYDKNCVADDKTFLRGNVAHYMVRVGEVFIDFTARQFFKDAPYPTVYTSEDMNAMWDEWGEE